MNTRVQKTFEALFALEDLREVMRGSLPTGLSKEQEAEFSRALARVKEAIGEIESRKGSPKFSRIVDDIEIRSREEEYINIHPIQPGGRLAPEARKAFFGEAASL